MKNKIILNALEANVASQNQQKVNALGFQMDITTLTAIQKKVTEQRFFEIAPADYIPVRVGEGAWSSELLTFTSQSIGGEFEMGIVNTAVGNAALNEMDAGVDGVRVPVINWAKKISWNLFDLEQAQRSGNWDVVVEKEKSRKRNWDLGIQKIAFVGLQGNTAVDGLLTQSDVTVNTSLITKRISAMTSDEFETFISGVLEAYRVNANRTVMPDRFIIPEGDYNGLAVATDEAFPLKSKLERLLEAFRLITRNPNFQILPLAYADKVTNAGFVGLNKNRYTLTKYDDTSIRMDIPVDYNNTLQNTINGFAFENVGYGQFTGVKAYRPLETLYFDYT